MKTTPLASGLALLVAIAVIVGIVYLLVVPTTDGSTFVGEPDLKIDLIGGEFDSMFGFGNPQTSIGSPGPEILVKQGQAVRVTLLNVGEIPHTFQIVEENWFENKLNAVAVFGAKIGSNTTPLNPGKAGTTTFLADKTGTFQYICTIPGHADRGMIGTIIVES